MSTQRALTHARLTLQSSPHPPNESAQLPFALDKRIGLMINFAKKEGQVASCPKGTNIRVIILCVGIFMLSCPPQICQPPDFYIKNELVDDQKPNLGYVCISDGYFYFNTPASTRQAVIN